MKKAESFLLGLLTAILFLTLSVSCSDSDSEPSPTPTPSPSPSPTPTSGYAPENVAGKEFRFYNTGKDNYEFKVIAAENPSNAKFSAPSSDIIFATPYFDYSKTGKNSAYAYCSFISQMLGAFGVFSYDYEFNLTFLSEHYGTVSGYCIKDFDIDKKDTITGVFVYDSNKTPTELAAELEDEDDDNKSQIDWRYLTATTWLEEVPGMFDTYLKFDDNGNYKKTLVYESDPENPITGDGKYTINKSTNVINLSGFGNNKVVQLTQSTLMLIAELPDGSYPSDGSTTATYHATSSGMPDTPQTSEFAVSEPIIEVISETSATVKGTIIGEGVTFQERGVCYSTEANPTVSDKVIKSNTNVINSTISGLYAGTTYYVRLYAKVNDKITYGKQLYFTTLGRAATSIELTPYQVSRVINSDRNGVESKIEITAKLPNNISNYGICYSTNPNPKITDHSLSEEYRKTAWTIEPLGRGRKYYIRAYHIQGSEIIYYENSEICVETIGANIDFKGNYYAKYVKFSWQGLEDCTYRVDVEARRYYNGDCMDTTWSEFFINGDSDGETSHFIEYKDKNNYDFFNHLYFTITPIGKTSTIKYYYQTYRSFYTNDWVE